MEWLRKILSDSTAESGATDIEAAVSAILREMPKYTVTKDVYNELKGKLTDAANKIAELSKNDFEGLKNDLERERTLRQSDRREFSMRNALGRAGALDTDYLLYKLKDSAAFGDNGTLQDEEEFVKRAKDNYKSMFRQKTAEGVKPYSGGEPLPEITAEQFENMDYFKRAELYDKNPELYKKLTGGT